MRKAPLGIATVAIGVLFASQALALENFEADLPPSINFDVPFAVSAKFTGNGSPVTNFKLQISLDSGESGESDCFVRDPENPFPASGNYSESVTIAATSTSQTTSTVAYIYANQYTDSECTNPASPAVIGPFYLPGTTSTTAHPVNVGAYFDENSYTLLSLSSTGTEFAISSPQELCANFATTSGGWLDNIGNSITRGFCLVGSYLFVPSQNSISKLVGLKTSLDARFPFSTVASIRTTLGALHASSTENFATVSIPLHGKFHVTSTTFGDIVPDLPVLSSSTVLGISINSDIAGWIRLIRDLVGWALVIDCCFVIYHRGQRLFNV